MTSAEELAAERRELVARNLLSNLTRTGRHPMLNTVLEIADVFGLTLDGAHRIFGYDLAGLRTLDTEMNSARTRIIDTYSFRRDVLVDLPGQLGEDEVFQRDASLREMVLRWQRGLPIRVLSESAEWQRPDVFYVRVGLEDSLESSLPPGSLALVQPVSDVEARRPDPRVIYLLQFGNGYRCGRCVVAGRKLILLSSGRLPSGQREFHFPSAVRVIGRIRVFALELPIAESFGLQPLPDSVRPAPLLLPWEHQSLTGLFSTKHLRFRRSRRDRERVRERLGSIFHSDLSRRTERRYRKPTSSLPHVDSLIQMSVANFARYEDSTGALRLRRSDQHRFSLETLLNVRNLDEISLLKATAPAPFPASRWDFLRETYVEWPTLLSLTFPHLELLNERIIRLAEGIPLAGVTPPIGPGSFLLLEPLDHHPNLSQERKRLGWQRPLYVSRRGGRVVCGYLEIAGSRLVLAGGGTMEPVIVTDRTLSSLERVIGVAVPV
jgi:hypothetical protein